MSGFIVVGIALAAVVAILVAGLSTLWIGGDTQRRWSNKLMRYRVIAQFIAIVVVLLVLWLAKGH
jgi:hypothetical protein